MGAPSTFLDCVHSVASRGQMIVIGVAKHNVDFNYLDIQRKELNIFGSRNSLPEDFRTLIRLVAEGSVDPLPMVSAVYSFERCQDAFDALVHNDGSLSKVLIRFYG